MSEEILRGEALDSLKKQSGYRILINEIIYPMFEDAMLELEEKDNPDARATIRAIKNIVSKIDDKINLGKQMADEYREQLNKHTEGTPE